MSLLLLMLLQLLLLLLILYHWLHLALDLRLLRLVKVMLRVRLLWKHHRCGHVGQDDLAVSRALPHQPDEIVGRGGQRGRRVHLGRDHFGGGELMRVIRMRVVPVVWEVVVVLWVARGHGGRGQLMLMVVMMAVAGENVVVGVHVGGGGARDGRRGGLRWRWTGRL